MLAPLWRHHQFVPSCCAGATVGRALLGAGDPSSLPSLPQTVQVRSSPWARRGLLLAPARSEQLSSPDGCDSGFYPDCFCQAAVRMELSPWVSWIPSRAVTHGQCPSKVVCVPEGDMPWVLCDPASSQCCWHPGQGTLGWGASLLPRCRHSGCQPASCGIAGDTVTSGCATILAAEVAVWDPNITKPLAGVRWVLCSLSQPWGGGRDWW